jgi:hypothetical protein
MSRPFFCTLALTIALATGANAAKAAGYDSGWQEQLVYRSSGSVGYDDGSYSAPRVIHRVRYTNSAYTITRRVMPAPTPCH